MCIRDRDYTDAKVENITTEREKNAELNIYTCSNDWWNAVKQYNCLLYTSAFVGSVATVHIVSCGLSVLRGLPGQGLAEKGDDYGRGTGRAD